LGTVYNYKGAKLKEFLFDLHEASQK
jgi:hypothetical protein